MTSACELFHSRRYRSGARHTSVVIPGLDSSTPDSTSSSSSSSPYQHRSTIRRHSQYYSSQSNRREHRHDFDGCAPASRRIHRHRIDHLEHQPVSLEEGSSHTRSDSIINTDGFSSINRHSRPTGTRNDRLPGSVLLARERLVERLRGVTFAGNRQSNMSSSTTHQNVSEIRNNTMAETVSESWQDSRTRNRSSGLNEDELKQLEAFSSVSCRQNDESSSISMECTVCLEGFEDGDKIVCLICTHRFHSCCLLPWVRVCGACPNCRKPVIVNVPNI